MQPNITIQNIDVLDYNLHFKSVLCCHGSMNTTINCLLTGKSRINVSIFFAIIITNTIVSYLTIPWACPQYRDKYRTVRSISKLYRTVRFWYRYIPTIHRECLWSAQHPTWNKSTLYIAPLLFFLFYFF